MEWAIVLHRVGIVEVGVAHLLYFLVLQQWGVVVVGVLQNGEQQLVGTVYQFVVGGDFQRGNSLHGYTNIINKVFQHVFEIGILLRKLSMEIVNLLELLHFLIIAVLVEDVYNRAFFLLSSGKEVQVVHHLTAWLHKWHTYLLCGHIRKIIASCAKRSVHRSKIVVELHVLNRTGIVGCLNALHLFCLFNDRSLCR